MNYAILSAGITGVLAFWGQLQGFFSRFTSILIVKVKVESDSADAVMRYLWKTYKRSPLGMQRYSQLDGYIKPETRWGVVASEIIGESCTFFHGLRPLFASASRNKDGHMNNGIEISFIRGTFDIEEIMIKAIDVAFEDQMKKHLVSSDRFRIIKKFGSRRSGMNGNETVRGEEAKGITPSSNNRAGHRLLKYKDEEIGIPNPIDPFKNFVANDEIEGMLRFLKKWESLGPWYREKGIPQTFGALFYGLPGTGKTALARAIAQMLKIPVYIFDLTGMDNQDFNYAWQDARRDAPCMVLFEDMDRSFNDKKELISEHGLTLNVILNCMQGVEGSDGIITIVTANDETRLDSAIGVPDLERQGKSTRPGRIDTCLKFTYADNNQKHKIAHRILHDTFMSHEIKTIVEIAGRETGAQFTKRCELLAVERKINEEVALQKSVPIHH